MSYPLDVDDVPVEFVDAVWCDVCGRRGYSDSTMMMRITNARDVIDIWVHSDICFQKWYLRQEEEEE